MENRGGQAGVLFAIVVDVLLASRIHIKDQNAPGVRLGAVAVDCQWIILTTRPGCGDVLVVQVAPRGISNRR